MPKYPFMIHGSRGSRPVWGDRFRRFMGSTSCYSLWTPEGVLIFDAGTGIASLGEELFRKTKIPPLTLLFTHFHLDHIMGLPSLKPFYRKDAEITLMAHPLGNKSWKDVLNRILTRPVWPLPVFDQGAKVTFKDLPGSKRHRGKRISTESFQLYGVHVSYCLVRHPQWCISYKVRTPDKTIVLATDREHGHEKIDRAFIEFCRGADILIHDAQYLPEEYSRHRGWGHSTWRMAVEVAKKAAVGELILTHNDPERSDDEIDEMVMKARKLFPKTYAASQNMLLL